MAREDLLANLLTQLTLKETPPQTDDNTLIQKMIAPNETMQTSDQPPTFTLLNPSTFVWGGYKNGSYVSPGWKYGGGQYWGSPYLSAVLKDRPVAYYRMNEQSGTTVNDSSGNGYNGTIHGGVTLAQSGAVQGDTAMGFDGSTGYISGSSIPSVGTGDFTLEAWVSYTVTPSNYMIFFDWPGATTDTWMGLSSSGQHAPTFIYQGNAIYAAKLYNDGLYHHWVAVKQGNEILFYIDGVLIGTNSSITPFSLSAGGFQIGRWNSQYYWNGLIGEVAFYNYALTPQQISNHYGAANKGA